MRILIVDDNPAVAKTLAMVLTRWNFAVQFCHNGFVAIETARSFLPKIVLTDLGLPQMNGYKLAEELRRIPGLEGIALIAISGYGQASDRERSRAAGFAHHLVKPIDPDVLEKILNKFARELSNEEAGAVREVGK